VALNREEREQAHPEIINLDRFMALRGFQPKQRKGV